MHETYTYQYTSDMVKPLRRSKTQWRLLSPSHTSFVYVVSFLPTALYTDILGDHLCRFLFCPVRQLKPSRCN